MFSQTEHCLLCSSKNKLLVSDIDHAWECWNCNTRWWIDDQSKLEYMVFTGTSNDEATEHLCCVGERPHLNFCMIESND